MILKYRSSIEKSSKSRIPKKDIFNGSGFLSSQEFEISDFSTSGFYILRIRRFRIRDASFSKHWDFWRVRDFVKLWDFLRFRNFSKLWDFLLFRDFSKFWDFLGFRYLVKLWDFCDIGIFFNFGISCDIGIFAKSTGRDFLVS